MIRTKNFAVKHLEWGWAFLFCGSVIGIGADNRRYFDSHTEIVSRLQSLGITPNEYEDQGENK